MKRKINYYLLIMPLLALFASCSRDAFDEYYGRPDYLEDPIYQQLDTRGNFKNFTALIEKAGYKDILSKSGYWTMFAPNDAAFTKYFQEKGISDVSKIDDATASKIVKYALVYNAFRKDQLSDYQSSKGWVADNAFRRRTAFYDGYVTRDVNGVPTVTVAANRNGAWFAGDNNNKYVTYFTDEYFAAKNLSATDFNFFYPSGQYTGFNLFDSKVVQTDIVAENGIIHEVDKVNLPLLNIEQYLEEDSKKAVSKYSEFRKLIENNLIIYGLSQTATTNYYNYTGKSDNVYVRFYDPTLAFSPNNENYVKLEDNDGQADAYTLFAPENNAFIDFRDKILLKHYSSVAALPRYVIQDLVNAHMVQGAVWPSLKENYINGLKEELRFDFNTDITDKQVLSNGFFYGTNKVQKSDLFYSVYTSAYLDPDFLLATRLLNETPENYKGMVSDISQKFTLFLPSDAVLKSLGISYDFDKSAWVYSTKTDPRNKLLRLLYNCIVLTPNGELDNIGTTSGIIRTGDDEIPGEYIRWNNNKIYAAGNDEDGTYVNIVKKEVQQNGTVYYIDNLPKYAEKLQGLAIEKLAPNSTSQFYSFVQYLKNSSIYTAATGKIEGVELGSSYTFIVPNNAAIAKAITDGVLPSNPATTVQGEKDLIADFIRYHIIVKTVSNDGLSIGQFETLRKNSKGDKTYVGVSSTPGSSSVPGTLTFKDVSPVTNNNAAAKIIVASSNNLADRSLIQLVDNYLKYTEF
ncbi:hypothetical protein EOD40_00125 [Flavobacterium sufflavum]|uniref:FAS1 domain-containing protein n=1 Tax=Flavobacterium sufflavum TaxID=1921138 RepID=A0A3S2U645_9FLAO|nr:fasciclin domain-containing protein [Flavobacterium sufflavum]RVT79557.1 hypothetical protein EOD40_00125 [Flavobacterium sufflavum]